MARRKKSATKPLEKYRAKRDFARTPEPLASDASERSDLFVVH